MNFFQDDNPFVGFAVAPAGVKTNAEPSDAVFEKAIEDLAEQQLRADAMGIALTFIDDGDYSSEYLEAMLMGFVDGDEDEELSDEESQQYQELGTALVDAFVSLGASEENATAAVAGDDEAAERLGDFLAGKLEDNPKSDDEIIAKFAVETGMVLERVKRVIRDGQLKTIKVPVRRKRLTAAQRAALRKARKKAHTAAAKRARAKSMRKRQSRGL